jgi:hypothetical protein
MAYVLATAPLAAGSSIGSPTSSAEGSQSRSYIISAALPAESDLVTDDVAGTAHQTGRVDVDRLVARRPRVGPSWTMTGASVRTFDRLIRHLEVVTELPVRRCRCRCTLSRLS